MNFTPKTEEELQRDELSPAGDYQFRVIAASEETSKKTGNPMIKVKLELEDGNHVYDYLIATFERKIRHFCAAVGLLEKYDTGSLAARDCMGCEGLAKIVIKPAQGNFSAKNEVKDYLVDRDAKPAVAKPASAGIVTDPVTGAVTETNPPSDPGSDDVPF